MNTKTTLRTATSQELRFFYAQDVRYAAGAGSAGAAALLEVSDPIEILREHLAPYNETKTIQKHLKLNKSAK